MAFHDSLCASGMKCERQMSTKTLVLTIALLTGLVALGGTTPLLAQSPSFPDFSSTTNLVFNGTALKSGNVLRLNPSLQSQAGSAWYSVLQPVANGFSTTFKFQITNASNPSADGIAFVIQNSQAGLQALGDGGGGIGYQGIDNSLAIEFDTYANFYDPVFTTDPTSHPPITSPSRAVASAANSAESQRVRNQARHAACQPG